MTAGRSAVSRRGLVVVLTVAFVSVAHGRVGAYKFFTEGSFAEGYGREDREGRLIVASEDALRWSPDVWGPGDTLLWEIAPDPDFELVFGGPQGVVPFVEQALAAWSDLPSAAISWRVSGIGDEVQKAPTEDGRNTFFVSSEGGDFGAAALWEERSSMGWGVTECDVHFSEDWIPEGLAGGDLEMYVRASWQGTLVHEFGHCLGLDHSVALSVAGREVFRFGRRRIHPLDPNMSYGRWRRGYGGPEALMDLAHDEVVGASLLRPADGWKRTTGSISGVLDLPGEEAARYAHVWALPVDGDPLRDRVGAFTNRVGAFLIEGLRPGNYALWAQPRMSRPAHTRLEDAVFDLEDTVLGRLVRVRAGGTTGGVEIPVRRGRGGRPPPEAVATPRHSDSGTPINHRWGNTCSGVRIRGEPPFPADGPLWFQHERWFTTRLIVEWSPEAGNAVFDWVGPWIDWHENGWFLDISISDYRIEASGPVTRHIMDIEWPETTEVRLRFRSEDGACDGEPTVVCNLAGCGITR